MIIQDNGGIKMKNNNIVKDMAYSLLGLNSQKKPTNKNAIKSQPVKATETSSLKSKISEEQNKLDKLRVQLKKAYNNSAQIHLNLSGSKLQREKLYNSMKEIRNLTNAVEKQRKARNKAQDNYFKSLTPKEKNNYLKNEFEKRRNPIKQSERGR